MTQQMAWAGHTRNRQDSAQSVYRDYLVPTGVRHNLIVGSGLDPEKKVFLIWAFFSHALWMHGMSARQGVLSAAFLALAHDLGGCEGSCTHVGERGIVIGYIVVSNCCVLHSFQALI